MTIADTLIARAFSAVEKIHGQFVTVLSGTDAGRVFTGILTVEQSIEIESGDAREKVMCIFKRGASPSLESQNQIQDSSGTVWKVVNRKDNPVGNTVDFELVRIVAGKDL